MIRATLFTLLALELGAGFGAATANVVSTTQESMIVEFHVEVDGSPDSVVVHLALPGEDTVTVPLVPREGGGFGVTTEVKPADYEVVFEVLSEPSVQSRPVSLTDLGVELDVGGSAAVSTTEAVETSPATRRWLWLGVALGAASLSALAFWVLGGRDDEEIEDDAATEPSVEEEAPVP